MNRHLQPYPAYKPSGVEWLGDVPSHWEMRPLKHWVGINEVVLSKGTNPDFEFHYVEIGAVRTGVLIDEPRRIRFADAPSRARRVVRKGDTIISTVRTYLKAVWSADETTEDLICSTGFAVLSPRRRTAPKFLKYLAQSNSFTDRMSAESVGIAYPAIAEGKFSSFHICIPPLPEQNAIVRYLDHVDERIQRYIEAKEKLISLLQEARQATIHRAVTRGLNPDVPLKPSGVEWLEDVPAHWEVRRLKTLCSMKSGDGISVMSIEPVGEYPVYGGNGLRGYTSRYNHDGAFALIGRQGALCGNVHIAQGKFWATEHAVVVTHDTGHDVEWFGAILTAMNLNQYSIAAAQPGLAIERILHLHLPVPPVHEQKLIAAHLDNATAAIDAAIDTARRQSELMREYLTSLIAHVVTGKLDVRKTAAHFPLESSEEISTVR